MRIKQKGQNAYMHVQIICKCNEHHACATFIRAGGNDYN